MERMFLAVWLLALCALTASSSAPLVNAPWGSVEGVTMEGLAGRRLNAYLGIPYALPPTGPLRFQKPHPHPGPGEGRVFVADTYSPGCPQDPMLIGETFKLDEDCLTLNVFVPTTVTSPKPVMVWIHGGALIVGEAASYRPFKLVADGDVIVVSIQYRLAALGFMSTGDDTLPGNLGLWDQNLAFHWVKDNIQAFGGDPDVVTIFGESAGSWSSSLHIVSPYSKGLFRRAVLQSGSPQSAVSFAAEDRVGFEGVSSKLGCAGDTDATILECLMTKSTDEILNKTSVFAKESGLLAPFGARVDGNFIPRSPVELAADEQYVQDSGMGDVDIIMGFNNQEGGFVTVEYEGSPMKGFSKAMVFMMLLDTSIKLFNNKKSDELVSKVVDFFYRRADFGSNTSVVVQDMANLYGDAVMYAPTYEWLRPMVAQTHAGKRYLYIFEHEFSFNEHTIQGSHHGDELFVEFDITLPEDSLYNQINKTTAGCNDNDHKMGDLFVSIITTFAKTGDPNPALKDALGSDWPEFTSEDEAVLSLSLPPHVLRDVMKDRIALWVKLVPEILSAKQRQKEEATSTEGATKDEL